VVERSLDTRLSLSPAMSKACVIMLIVAGAQSMMSGWEEDQ
jgi:hypothetical protein